jgi:hypothetical protein
MGQSAATSALMGFDGESSNRDSGSSLRAQLDLLNGKWLAGMRAGRFAEAWGVSDEAHRLRAGIDCSAWPRHEQFIWRGESLAGRRVLVRCYHGLGDTIQFVRFVPRVRRLARELTLWVQPTLIPLLTPISGVDRILPLNDDAPNVTYDVDVELAELMHVLRVTPETLATDCPYLHVAPARLPDTCALRVGLVWAAGDWDARRSIPCQLLASLARIPGVEWHLLQRGPMLGEWPHGFGMVPQIDGIVDEARALRALDLLITVDTCSAHLAGALGVRVWTLLPYDADWRWMRNRSDTPWYPTMRLIRQRCAGEWHDVLHRVERDLRAERAAAPRQGAENGAGIQDLLRS